LSKVALSQFRWLGWFLFTLIGCLIFSLPAFANPTMEIGGLAAFPPTGTDSPASGLTWDIALNGATVATNLVPNGWSVNTDSYQGPQIANGIRVGAPFTAQLATNYEVRTFGPGSGGGGTALLVPDIEAPGSFYVLCAGSRDVDIESSCNTAFSCQSGLSPVSAHFDVVSGLTLTQAGINRGFGLTIFATRFPYWTGFGPMSALVESAGVLCTDFPGDTRVFATDTDQQFASNATIGMSVPSSNTQGLALLNGAIYMAQRDYADVVQLHPNGTYLQTIATGVNLAAGMVADPFTNHLFVSAPYGGDIYDVDPIAHTSTVWLSGLDEPDGLALSFDGKTLYIALDEDNNIIGVDTSSKQIVFNYNLLNPFVPIQGPDGIALGSGVLKGYAYVNTNYGCLYEITLATGAATLIASGGTRGDFVYPDPNGTLFISQVERIKRLIPPAGGSFGGGGAIVSRDDRTNPSTTPYTPFTLAYPSTSLYSTQAGQFDLSGFAGSVALGSMQRGGQLSWNTGDSFDLQLGLHSSTARSGPFSLGPLMSAVQNNANPSSYTYTWDLPAAFLPDIQSKLGQVYTAVMMDQVGTGTSTYTITDAPEQNWPNFYGKNVLTVVVNPGGNPSIEQGRCQDVMLPNNDTVQNGSWEILFNQSVIASSVNPNGWNVEPDISGYYGAWVSVPANATVAQAYEVRCTFNQEAGFFDVIASGSTSRAAVMRLISVGANPLVGGNSTVGTITLDAPAPTGGATVSLLGQIPGVSVPTSLTIPAGSTTGTFTISSQSVTIVSGGTILASYNGVRRIPFYVVPAVGTPVYRINCAGPDVAPFVADTNFSGGTSFSVVNTIDLSGATNPAPMAVYQSQRTDPTSFSYILPDLIPGMAYTVRLHFAELVFTATGQRLINTSINGTNVLNSFDVVAAAGGAFKAIVCDFNATADANGRITVVFTSANAQPTICNGIEIITAVSGAPAAPTGLTATAATGQVTLNWSPALGADAYNVKRSTTHGGPYTTIASGVPNIHYLDTSVTNGTTYYYVVTAVNFLGESPNSNEASATPNATASVAGLVFHPNPVLGGNPSIGTLSLGSPALPGGLPATLSVSGSAPVTVPTSIVVPAGSYSVDFVANTSPVANTATDTITATSGSSHTSGTLTVQAPSVLAMTFNPNPVVGGNSTIGTVTLNAKAPPGGATVSLLSGAPNIVTVPASVVVAAGNTQATFSVTTNSVVAATAVPITATYNGLVITNLMVYPTNINVYLSNLTVSPTGVVGAGTSTGTVSLNAPAPAGGAIVQLKSNDPNVTVPVNVTVPAGSQSASFTIACAGELNLTYANISGSYNTWTQAAILTTMPAGYPLTIENLTAYSGNGSSLLQWYELPGGAVTGYNVYRIVGGIPILLNAAPLTCCQYGDVNLTNGTLYQYQVTVVDLQGNEGPASSVIVTPSASLPALSWVQPAAQLSGEVLLQVLSNSTYPADARLLIDGKEGRSIFFSTDLAGVSVALNTTGLSNGAHAVQIVGTDGNTAFVSPFLTIQVNNSVSSVTSGHSVELDQGYFALLEATIPSNAASWSLSILDSQGNTVRSWNSNASTAHLAWDGLDSSGAKVTSDYYQYQLTTYNMFGQQQTQNGGTIVVSNAATYALAMIDYSYPGDGASNGGNAIEDDWTNQLKSMFKSEHLRNGNEEWLVFGPAEGDYSEPEMNRMRVRIQNAQVFYVYAHGYRLQRPGAMLTTRHKNITFHPEEGERWWAWERDLYLPNIVQSTYKFVFLNCCFSGGGSGWNEDDDLSVILAARYQMSKPDPKWSNAFLIQPDTGQIDDDNGVFWGWSSEIPAHYKLDPNNNSKTLRTNYFWWNYYFWQALLSPDGENYVKDAKDMATTATLLKGISDIVPNYPKTVNPWDWDGTVARGVFMGDLLGRVH